MAERFKERVDDVKCDLLDAFKTLVFCDNSGTGAEMEKKRVLTLLSSQILQSLVKQATSKNLKVKIGVMSGLSALANTLQENMDQHFDFLLPVIQATVEDQTNFEPLLDSLRILKSLFKHATSKKFLVQTQQI